MVDFSFLGNIINNTEVFGSIWFIPTVLVGLTAIAITTDTEELKSLFFPLSFGFHAIGVNQSFLVMLFSAVVYVQEGLSINIAGTIIKGVKQVGHFSRTRAEKLQGALAIQSVPRNAVIQNLKYKTERRKLTDTLRNYPQIRMHERMKLDQELKDLIDMQDYTRDETFKLKLRDDRDEVSLNQELIKFRSKTPEGRAFFRSLSLPKKTGSKYTKQELAKRLAAEKRSGMQFAPRKVMKQILTDMSKKRRPLSKLQKQIHKDIAKHSIPRNRPSIFDNPIDKMIYLNKYPKPKFKSVKTVIKRVPSYDEWMQMQKEKAQRLRQFLPKRSLRTELGGGRGNSLQEIYKQLKIER